jgi:hypothetical protein
MGSDLHHPTHFWGFVAAYKEHFPLFFNQQTANTDRVKIIYILPQQHFFAHTGPE